MISLYIYIYMCVVVLVVVDIVSSGKLHPVRLRYFLLLTQCGTHQSALSAKCGVIGRAAAAAAKLDGGEKVFEDVTSTTVRLFKYLAPQYYEDFKKSSDAWASHL